MGYDLAPPEPAGMVASLSSLGYSLPDALADLVDNSVSAGARTIDVEFTWNGADSWIAVVDDGDGMSEGALVTAMTVAARGPATDRSATDLGRYGVGLKSASFSQCRLLTVCTAKTDGSWRTRTWDLDVVERTGEWRLLHEPSSGTGELLDRLTEGLAQGTVVLWQRLSGYRGVAVDDQKTQQQFYDESEKVSAHLGLVYAWFLTGSSPLALRVAGIPVPRGTRSCPPTRRCDDFPLSNSHSTDTPLRCGPSSCPDPSAFRAGRPNRPVAREAGCGSRGSTCTGGIG